MAIQINGTTVIDNSRNLQNVQGIKTVGGQSILGSGNIDAGVGFTLSYTNPIIPTMLPMINYDADRDEMYCMGRGERYVWRTSDGLNWAKVNNTDNLINGGYVIYGVADNGSGTYVAHVAENKFYYSTNGMSTWGSTNYPGSNFTYYSPYGGQKKQIIWNGSAFVFGGYNTNFNGPYFAYSTNGTSWSQGSNNLDGSSQGNNVPNIAGTNGVTFTWDTQRGNTHLAVSTNHSQSWTSSAVANLSTSTQMGWPMDAAYSPTLNRIVVVTDQGKVISTGSNGSSPTLSLEGPSSGNGTTNVLWTSTGKFRVGSAYGIFESSTGLAGSWTGSGRYQSTGDNCGAVEFDGIVYEGGAYMTPTLSKV